MPFRRYGSVNFVVRLAYAAVATMAFYLTLWHNGDRLKDRLFASRRMTTDTYDFIVVGAGSAGAVVAHRLSEKFNVLLLEAGGEPFPLSNVPAFTMYLLNYPTHDWNFRTIPQKGACLAFENQQSGWSQGKVLGGTSTINFMAYTRGHPRDYDTWANITGDSRWNYDNLLPYFKKSEDYAGAYELTGLHGKAGPLRIQIPDDGQHAVAGNTFVQAAIENGYPKQDMNGRFTEGFDRVYYPIKNGQRQSTFNAFLRPIRRRRSLTIAKFAHVNQVLLRSGTNEAYGVEYERHGRTRQAFATKEVILSAGSVQSPKLLMLSGIGPKEHLESLRIDVHVDSPGVGQNMQDHASTALGPFISQASTPSTVSLERDLRAREVISYFSRGSGIFANSGLSGMGYISTSYAKADGEGDWPDIQYIYQGVGVYPRWAEHFSHGFHLRRDLMETYFKNAINKDSFLIMTSISRPRQRGEIKLTSKNPKVPPYIDPKYLQDDQDVRVGIEGMKKAIELVETAPIYRKLQTSFTNVSFPGCEQCEFRTDAYWECYLRHLTVTLHHIVGTCSMGPPGAKDAVVDSELRVNGVKNLRVIDASVAPKVPVGNTNAMAIMIGERGAQFILERWSSSGTKSGPQRDSFEPNRVSPAVATPRTTISTTTSPPPPIDTSSLESFLNQTLASYPSQNSGNSQSPAVDTGGGPSLFPLESNEASKELGSKPFETVDQGSNLDYPVIGDISGSDYDGDSDGKPRPPFQDLFDSLDKASAKPSSVLADSITESVNKFSTSIIPPTSTESAMQSSTLSDSDEEAILGLSESIFDGEEKEPGRSLNSTSTSFDFPSSFDSNSNESANQENSSLPRGRSANSGQSLETSTIIADSQSLTPATTSQYNQSLLQENTTTPSIFNLDDATNNQTTKKQDEEGSDSASPTYDTEDFSELGRVSSSTRPSEALMTTSTSEAEVREITTPSSSTVNVVSDSEEPVEGATVPSTEGGSRTTATTVATSTKANDYSEIVKNTSETTSFTQIASSTTSAAVPELETTPSSIESNTDDQTTSATVRSSSSTSIVENETLTETFSNFKPNANETVASLFEDAVDNPTEGSVFTSSAPSTIDNVAEAIENRTETSTPEISSTSITTASPLLEATESVPESVTVMETTSSYKNIVVLMTTGRLNITTNTEVPAKEIREFSDFNLTTTKPDPDGAGHFENTLATPPPQEVKNLGNYESITNPSNLTSGTSNDTFISEDVDVASAPTSTETNLNRNATTVSVITTTPAATSSGSTASSTESLYAEITTIKMPTLTTSAKETKPVTGNIDDVLSESDPLEPVEDLGKRESSEEIAKTPGATSQFSSTPGTIFTGTTTQGAQIANTTSATVPVTTEASDYKIVLGEDVTSRTNLEGQNLVRQSSTPESILTTARDTTSGSVGDSIVETTAAPLKTTVKDIQDEGENNIVVIETVSTASTGSSIPVTLATEKAVASEETATLTTEKAVNSEEIANEKAFNSVQTSTLTTDKAVNSVETTTLTTDKAVNSVETTTLATEKAVNSEESATLATNQIRQDYSTSTSTVLPSSSLEDKETITTTPVSTTMSTMKSTTESPSISMATEKIDHDESSARTNLVNDDLINVTVPEENTTESLKATSPLIAMKDSEIKGIEITISSMDSTTTETTAFPSVRDPQLLSSTSSPPFGPSTSPTQQQTMTPSQLSIQVMKIPDAESTISLHAEIMSMGLPNETVTTHTPETVSQLQLNVTTTLLPPISKVLSPNDVTEPPDTFTTPAVSEPAPDLPTSTSTTPQRALNNDIEFLPETTPISETTIPVFKQPAQLPTITTSPIPSVTTTAPPTIIPELPSISSAPRMPKTLPDPDLINEVDSAVNIEQLSLETTTIAASKALFEETTQTLVKELKQKQESSTAAADTTAATPSTNAPKVVNGLEITTEFQNTNLMPAEPTNFQGLLHESKEIQDFKSTSEDGATLTPVPELQEPFASSKMITTTKQISSAAETSTTSSTKPSIFASTSKPDGKEAATEDPIPAQTSSSDPSNQVISTAPSTILETLAKADIAKSDTVTTSSTSDETSTISTEGATTEKVTTSTKLSSIKLSFDTSGDMVTEKGTSTSFKPPDESSVFQTSEATTLKLDPRSSSAPPSTTLLTTTAPTESTTIDSISLQDEDSSFITIEPETIRNEIKDLNVQNLLLETSSASEDLTSTAASTSEPSPPPTVTKKVSIKQDVQDSTTESVVELTTTSTPPDQTSPNSVSLNADTSPGQTLTVASVTAKISKETTSTSSFTIPSKTPPTTSTQDSVTQISTSSETTSVTPSSSEKSTREPTPDLPLSPLPEATVKSGVSTEFESTTESESSADSKIMSTDTNDLQVPIPRKNDKLFKVPSAEPLPPSNSTDADLDATTPASELTNMEDTSDEKQPGSIFEVTIATTFISSTTAASTEAKDTTTAHQLSSAGPPKALASPLPQTSTEADESDKYPSAETTTPNATDSSTFDQPTERTAETVTTTLEPRLQETSTLKRIMDSVTTIASTLLQDSSEENELPTGRKIPSSDSKIDTTFTTSAAPSTPPIVQSSTVRKTSNLEPQDLGKLITTPSQDTIMDPSLSLTTTLSATSDLEAPTALPAYPSLPMTTLEDFKPTAKPAISEVQAPITPLIPPDSFKEIINPTIFGPQNGQILPEETLTTPQTLISDSDAEITVENSEETSLKDSIVPQTTEKINQRFEPIETTTGSLVIKIPKDMETSLDSVEITTLPDVKDASTTILTSSVSTENQLDIYELTSSMAPDITKADGKTEVVLDETTKVPPVVTISASDSTDGASVATTDAVNARLPLSTFTTDRDTTPDTTLSTNTQESEETSSPRSGKAFLLDISPKNGSSSKKATESIQEIQDTTSEPEATTTPLSKSNDQETAQHDKPLQADLDKYTISPEMVGAPATTYKPIPDPELLAKSETFGTSLAPESEVSESTQVPYTTLPAISSSQESVTETSSSYVPSTTTGPTSAETPQPETSQTESTHSRLNPGQEQEADTTTNLAETSTLSTIQSKTIQAEPIPKLIPESKLNSTTNRVQIEETTTIIPETEFVPTTQRNLALLPEDSDPDFNEIISRVTPRQGKSLETVTVPAQRTTESDSDEQPTNAPTQLSFTTTAPSPTILDVVTEFFSTTFSGMMETTTVSSGSPLLESTPETLNDSQVTEVPEQISGSTSSSSTTATTSISKTSTDLTSVQTTLASAMTLGESDATTPSSASFTLQSEESEETTTADPPSINTKSFESTTVSAQASITSEIPKTTSSDTSPLTDSPSSEATTITSPTFRFEQESPQSTPSPTYAVETSEPSDSSATIKSADLISDSSPALPIDYAASQSPASEESTTFPSTTSETSPETTIIPELTDSTTSSSSALSDVTEPTLLQIQSTLAAPQTTQSFIESDQDAPTLSETTESISAKTSSAPTATTIVPEEKDETTVTLPTASAATQPPPLRNISIERSGKALETTSTEVTDDTISSAFPPALSMFPQTDEKLPEVITTTPSYESTTIQENIAKSSTIPSGSELTTPVSSLKQVAETEAPSTEAELSTLPTTPEVLVEFILQTTQANSFDESETSVNTTTESSIGESTTAEPESTTVSSITDLITRVYKSLTSTRTSQSSTAERTDKSLTATRRAKTLSSTRVDKTTLTVQSSASSSLGTKVNQLPSVQEQTKSLDTLSLQSATAFSLDEDKTSTESSTLPPLEGMTLLPALNTATPSTESTEIDKTETPMTYPTSEKPEALEEKTVTSSSEKLPLSTTEDYYRLEFAATEATTLSQSEEQTTPAFEQRLTNDLKNVSITKSESTETTTSKDSLSYTTNAPNIETKIETTLLPAVEETSSVPLTTPGPESLSTIEDLTTPGMLDDESTTLNPTFMTGVPSRNEMETTDSDSQSTTTPQSVLSDPTETSTLPHANIEDTFETTTLLAEEELFMQRNPKLLNVYNFKQSSLQSSTLKPSDSFTEEPLDSATGPASPQPTTEVTDGTPTKSTVSSADTFQSDEETSSIPSAHATLHDVEGATTETTTSLPRTNNNEEGATFPAFTVTYKVTEPSSDDAEVTTAPSMYKSTIIPSAFTTDSPVYEVIENASAIKKHLTESLSNPSDVTDSSDFTTSLPHMPDTTLSTSDESTPPDVTTTLAPVTRADHAKSLNVFHQNSNSITQQTEKTKSDNTSEIPTDYNSDNTTTSEPAPSTFSVTLAAEDVSTVTNLPQIEEESTVSTANSATTFLPTSTNTNDKSVTDTAETDFQTTPFQDSTTSNLTDTGGAGATQPIDVTLPDLQLDPTDSLNITKTNVSKAADDKDIGSSLIPPRLLLIFGLFLAALGSTNLRLL